MKSVYTTTMKRSLGKTCIILALLILSSYLFTSRLGELIQIQEEIRMASEFYRPIGTLNVQGREEMLSTGIEMVEKSEYVSLVDKRQKPFAALEGIYNVDTEAVLAESTFYSMETHIHNSDFLFYGELVSCDLVVRETENYSAGRVELSAYELVFQV